MTFDLHMDTHVYMPNHVQPNTHRRSHTHTVVPQETEEPACIVLIRISVTMERLKCCRTHSISRHLLDSYYVCVARLCTPPNIFVSSR